MFSKRISNSIIIGFLSLTSFLNAEHLTLTFAPYQCKIFIQNNVQSNCDGTCNVVGKMKKMDDCDPSASTISSDDYYSYDVSSSDNLDNSGQEDSSSTVSYTEDNYSDSSNDKMPKVKSQEINAEENLSYVHEVRSLPELCEILLNDIDVSVEDKIDSNFVEYTVDFQRVKTKKDDLELLDLSAFTNVSVLDGHLLITVITAKNSPQLRSPDESKIVVYGTAIKSIPLPARLADHKFVRTDREDALCVVFRKMDDCSKEVRETQAESERGMDCAESRLEEQRQEAESTL